ncbi:MAG: transposase, partial [Bacteroidaceae bacterium]|nr:transposase [Bacteroidaceae bacterium]
KDDRSDAHLFFGLLAYWIVNTIRYKLKQKGYTSHWTEIVRVMKTQKAVTTEATNALGEKVHLRMCSEPNKAANNIYGLLNYSKMPFRRIRIEKSL